MRRSPRLISTLGVLLTAILALQFATGEHGRLVTSLLVVFVLATVLEGLVWLRDRRGRA
jgi:hypothetical protein